MSTQTLRPFLIGKYQESLDPSLFLRKIPFRARYSRLQMTALLVINDLINLLLAWMLAIIVRILLGGAFQSTYNLYIEMAPGIAIFIIAYAWRGLYPAVGVSPVEELRRLVGTTTVVLILLAAISYFIRSNVYYSRLTFIFFWFFACVFVQSGRLILRLFATRLGIWGEPVAVVGYGTQGQKVAKFLVNHTRFGFEPVVALIDDENHDDGGEAISQLRASGAEIAHGAFKKAGLQTAILVVSEMSQSLQDAIVDEQLFGFKHLIIISYLGGIGSIGVVPYDLEGTLAFGVRQNLLDPWEQGIKRYVDVLVALFGGLMLLPFLGLIAILIRLDSKGGALYRHERLGKDGKIFRAVKFRTMVSDADEILVDYLKFHPEARQEWEATRKLKNDPRVTRVGKFLRRTSLDEFPQLWNVLKGEMSLVGPRPIVQDEVKHYKRGYTLYKRVRPGMTGLWQVSGRNDVGYETRVRLDEYYVRNWTSWLDLFILLKTGFVVLRRKGAY
jgi:Undecaprenyl-phosphate galactose phosphotransferase WbaP